MRVWGLGFNGAETRDKPHAAERDLSGMGPRPLVGHVRKVQNQAYLDVFRIGA